MKSIEECKKILVDDNETYTDEEIKLIRDHLYKVLANVNKNMKTYENEKRAESA